MPVDKFGHTDSGNMQRVVAGGVTLTQVNNTFLRLDGTNAFTGNLNLGGKSIEGLSTTYTPSEDNHLTNKKYVDQRVASNATRDYVSGMKVSPGNLVRNTRSGIIYGFEGTSGIITAAPALSPNWRPTTGAVICSMYEGGRVTLEAQLLRPINSMLETLNNVDINTDSAYAHTGGLITIPRAGVYRLRGFVTITYINTPTPSGTFIRARYIRNRSNREELMPYWTQNDTSGTSVNITTILPHPVVSLHAGDRIGIKITTNASCSTGRIDGDARSSSELQVEFLY